MNQKTFLFLVLLIAGMGVAALLNLAQAQSPTLQIRNILAGGNTVGRYEKFELTFDITGTVATNPYFPYDPNPPNGVPAGVGISVDALFSPDNWTTVITQPAFLYQDYQRQRIGDTAANDCRSGAPIGQGILVDGDETGGQPGIVHGRDQVVVARIGPDYRRAPGNPVPLVEYAVVVGVGTVRLIGLRAGLPGAQLVQHGGDLGLGRGPGRAPGPAQVVGCQPEEGIEADLGRVGIVAAGQGWRPPTVGQVVGGSRVGAQVGPGVAGDGVQRILSVRQGVRRTDNRWRSDGRPACQHRPA